MEIAYGDRRAFVPLWLLHWLSLRSDRPWTAAQIDLVRLALFDTVLFVDDSGSMAFEENGSRIDDLKLVWSQGIQRKLVKERTYTQLTLALRM